MPLDNPFDRFDAPAANPFDRFDAAPRPTAALPSVDDEENAHSSRGLVPALTEAAAPTRGGMTGATPKSSWLLQQDREAPEIPAEQGMAPQAQPVQPGSRDAITRTGLGKIAEAAREGYASTPPLITPDSTAGKWLRDRGMEGLTMPVAPLAALSGGFRAVQEGLAQTGEAIGLPAAGREAAGYLEAFPLAGQEMGGFRPVVHGAREGAAQARQLAGETSRAALSDIAQGRAAPGAMPTLEAMAAEARPPETARAEPPVAEQPPTPEVAALAEIAEPAGVSTKHGTPDLAKAPDFALDGDMLDALQRRLDASDGAPVIWPSITDAEIVELHSLGILDDFGQVSYATVQQLEAERLRRARAPGPQPNPTAPDLVPEKPLISATPATESNPFDQFDPTPSKAQPYVPVSREPERLISFLRRPKVSNEGTIHETTIPGGLVDPGGDVSAIIGGNRGRPGLLNKAGRNLDDATLHAWEHGYFPEHSERPMINDLLDAIRDDHNGIARYSDFDREDAAAYHEARSYNQEIDRLADQFDIPTRGLTHDQFFDRVAERASADDVAREMEAQAAAHEQAYTEAEQAAHLWTAYHGTPHEFDAFDTSKIGTGEGAQAFGHGLYFAENEGVAEDYRARLSGEQVTPAHRALAARLQRMGIHENDAQDLASTANPRAAAQHIIGFLEKDRAAGASPGEIDSRISAIRFVIPELPEEGVPENKGHLLTVRIKAKPEEMLDWDKPRDQQPAAVQAAIKSAFPDVWDQSADGASIYQLIARRVAKPRDEPPPGWTSVPGGPVRFDGEVADPTAASAALRAAGIKGIRYLDRGSRTEGEGTHNVVVFDHNDVEITHRNGEPVAPESWNAQDFYGQNQARTLRDLENEHRQAETATATQQRAAGHGEPGPAGADQGAVQESGGPRTGGAGAGRRDEAAPTDLLGRPVKDPVAPRAPEPTARTDPRQSGIPGTEPSAVQAQAARDATGRGALQSDVTQKPADEGLFAPDTSGQGKLYSFPAALFDPDTYRRMAGPLAKPAAAAKEAINGLTRSISTGLFPMRNGTARAQAFAADFANSLRQVMYRFGEIDKEIERNFKPGERDQMGRALDAQSVFEQSLRDRPPAEHAAARAEFDASGAGLASLNPKQRHAVEMLDRLSQDAWRQMQERGMVDPNAAALPYYFPRQLVRWSEENGFTRVSGEGGAGRGLDTRGQNLTTSGPMRRQHLTPEETEAAARAKLGNDVQLLRDIRSLPQRLAFTHRAAAGVDLMNQIERVGRDTGVDLVVRGDIPGILHPGDFFTMADHPAFRRWTGSGWQPVHVATEFEGPLRAVLTQRSPTWYRAAAMIKSGVMNAIMYSPFIHLAVELGRALPVMPGRILTLRALRDGSVLRRDLGYMDQATRDGLAPLGQSWRSDPVSIADAATVDSKTGFLRALGNMRDAVANGAGKIGGEFAREVIRHPHQTLLWDQVFNLQVGIYDEMRRRYVEKGMSPDVAGTMAAHIANRYAGALPPEHLSRAANMAANLLLFSRSFTLGNLGVMKDMFTGAPPHVLARIEQMAGPAVAKSAQSALRRKAIAAVTMDIGLFYMANGLLQAGLQVLRNAPSQGLPAAAQQTYQQWLDEAGSAMTNAKDNPLEAFGVLPQHWNEPGKQDRVYAGTDSQGRGIYLRLPPGKVGEEFLSWPGKPGVMLANKSSPLVRPIIESIFNADSLGRQVYKPNPQTLGDNLRIAGAVVKHIGESLGPTSTIQGLHEMWQHYVQGQPSQGDPGVTALKILGPLTGLAQVSSGFPGGPAAGEMHTENERERYDIQRAMPDIRKKIAAGDIDGAVADMTALNVPRGLMKYYIGQTIQPGPSAGSLRRVPTLPPVIQERIQRQNAQP